MFQIYLKYKGDRTIGTLLFSCFRGFEFLFQNLLLGLLPLFYRGVCSVPADQIWNKRLLKKKTTWWLLSLPFFPHCSLCSLPGDTRARSMRCARSSCACSRTHGLLCQRHTWALLVELWRVAVLVAHNSPAEETNQSLTGLLTHLCLKTVQHETWNRVPSGTLYNNRVLCEVHSSQCVNHSQSLFY